ncbi:hypothetical protein TIFTF001_050430 [Ficus carica]|uniref:Trypsin-like protease inhibitor 1 n=1 Tax=Ficus carica TaxID=3494 RepID=A0A2Z6DRJ3_FICCA|nr:Trypsin-like protease inhibitor 1 [Ficus carica]GMN26716.1 hypothetical protein TIFTF001_050430 [Ficus carica]
MEATTLLITLPLILFLSFPTNGVSARHGFSIVDQPPAVLDASGRELLEGKYYYLRPALRLPPFGTTAIIPGVYRNETCWFHVGVERFPFSITGLPAKFSPVAPGNESSIRESTDVIIEFSDKLASVCGGSSVLKATRFLSLGGSGDRNSWFKIEKLPEPRHAYKLVYRSRRVVGTSTRPDNTERLALTDEPLPFEFRPI